MLLWNSVYAAAVSLKGRIRAWHGDGLRVGRTARGAHVRGGADGGNAIETEKESEGEGEGDEEKQPLIMMQHVNDPPSTTSPSIPNSAPPQPPPTIRSQTDSTLVEGLPVAAHSDPPFHPNSQTLLPHPLAYSLFPSSQSQLSTTPSRTPTPTSISLNSGFPATRKTTPFHMQKTLVLDLDETLIHSTSRPFYNASGSGGLLGGLGFSGLGLGNSRRASKSHMVEVVLGGRSTCYHVYKRPYVDYFLRKVRRGSPALAAKVAKLIISAGFHLVHTGHLHCVDARIRRSSH